VYYDTKDNELRDREISLRVRRIGRRHVQTVKAQATKALDRCEWEDPIDDSKPDRALARQTALKPFAGKNRWRKLRPVFETNINRTTLRTRLGESEIEVALDVGHIAAKRRRLAVSEIEIELKQGSPADLFVLARKLQARLELGLETASKASRG